MVGVTLNDDGIAARGLLGIFMTQKVLDSLRDVSRDSTKPMKIKQSRNITFGQTAKNVIRS